MAPVSIARTALDGTPADHRRAGHRLSICLSGAVLLHASALLVQVAPRLLGASAPGASDIADAVSVALEPLPPQSGMAPGGGSEQPDPKGAAHAAPQHPRERPSKVVHLGRTEVTRTEPSTGETVGATETLGQTPSPPDLLAAPEEAESSFAVRPRRRQFIDTSRFVAAAADRSNQPPSTSRFFGYGPGANGGPGGPGAGWGRGTNVVKQQFAFGGPTGAFQGDVCFFEEHVKSLLEIKNCRPVATFFTSTLNVPPRRFTAGFPGVTSRIEWFSIKYRGKFKVAEVGTYKFRLLSDDGAMLYIDGHRIVNNDGQHPPTSREASLALEAGHHDLFVHYYQGPRDNIALQLFVTPPSGVEKLLGPKL